jgi:D-alanine-D-alanine ligase
MAAKLDAFSRSNRSHRAWISVAAEVPIVDVVILFNEPTLAREHPDFAQEAGVLESVAAFERALSSPGHRVRQIGITDSVATVIEGIIAKRPDVIVNLCEGFGGHTGGEAHWAGLLELLGVPYTGSPPECLALVRDKARTKWLLSGAGLSTAPFVCVQPGERLPRQPLSAWLNKGPLFVKPASEDASLGIGTESVVTDWPALERQVETVAARYGAVLIETYIDGREFNVGVIESPEIQCLPLAEIEFQVSDDLRWPIVTYQGKWASGSAADRATPVRCPAEVEPALADSIRAVALAAYRVTGCRDYARVDLRVDRSGNIFILEVNANPDAGPNAGLARMLRAAGIEYDSLVERLVAIAAARIS